MFGWCKLPSCTEVFSYHPRENAAFFWLGAAFIGNFASICGVYSRVVFNRINTVNKSFNPSATVLRKTNLASLIHKSIGYNLTWFISLRVNLKIRANGRNNCQHCWPNNVGSCLDLPTNRAQISSRSRSASIRLFMFSGAKASWGQLLEPEMRSEGLW